MSHASPLPSEAPQANPRDLSGFAGVTTWIFDLDNTLYPPHTDLFAQVDKRMGDYVAQLLDMERDAAHLLQKEYYRRYGTTLRGLMLEHGINPDGSWSSCTTSTTPRSRPTRSFRRRSSSFPAGASS